MPAHERRWAHGAGGEEMVAEALDKKCRPEVVLLHAVEDSGCPCGSSAVWLIRRRVVVAARGAWQRRAVTGS
jgi:hypothetical protein